VKCETASSGVAAFIEPYRDMIWGMRYLLAPAILVTLSLVISNSISISVRERRTELAVLKVLGFRPNQILFLVLGEAVLIGALSGFLSAALTYGIVNFPQPYGFGGIKFPIAFFAAFLIPLDALWWGPALGAGTAFLGSVVPAMAARSVKVSEVFARVA
jgi:putative ABC transport system permease protein